MKAYAELGSELRSAREKAGRTISEVASETGLPERYVEALEKGEMGNLPDLSYARLYLQSYARSLRLDPESMLAAWPAARTSVPETRPPQEKSSRPKPRWPLYVTGLLLLIIAGFSLYNRLSSAPEGDSRAQKTPVQQQATRQQPLPVPESLPQSATSINATTSTDGAPGDLAEAQDAQSVATNPTVLEESAPTPDLGNTGPPATQPYETPSAVPVSPFVEPEVVPVTLRSLEVIVATQTWLVIEADGDTVVAKVAVGGETFSAEAQSDFRLTVANPRDLQVRLDGRPLELAVAAHRPLIRHLLPGKDTP